MANISIHACYLARVCAWTGTFKIPTKCIWRWEPDRRSNFFFGAPAHAHLSAVTNMTELSLNGTLNNKSHLLSLTCMLKHFYEVTPLSFQYFHVNNVLWSAATIHANVCLSPLTRK